MAFGLIGSDCEITLPSSPMGDEIFVLLIKTVNNKLKLAFNGRQPHLKVIYMRLIILDPHQQQLLHLKSFLPHCFSHILSETTQFGSDHTLVLFIAFPHRLMHINHVLILRIAV